MPWNLSGSGRRLLVSRRSASRCTDSSPVLVLNSVPSAPRMSPRSQCLKAAQRLGADRVLRDVELDAAAPSAVLQRGEAGLAHHALEHHAAGHRHLRPPAARAPRSAPAPCWRCRSAAWWRGLKSFGKAHALAARIAASFSRRSAISWLSSASWRRGRRGLGWSWRGAQWSRDSRRSRAGAGRAPWRRSVGDNSAARLRVQHRPPMTRRPPIADRSCASRSSAAAASRQPLRAPAPHADRAELVAVCDTDPSALAAAVQATGARLRVAGRAARRQRRRHRRARHAQRPAPAPGDPGRRRPAAMC